VIARLEQVDPDDWLSGASARLENARCMRHMLAHDWSKAEAAASRGIAAYDQAGRRDDAGYLVNSRALTLIAVGRTMDAIGHLQEAQQRAADFHLSRLHGLAGINLAWALLRLNRPEEAVDVARAADDDLAKQRLPEAAVAGYLAESAAARLAGDEKRAQEWRERALAAAVGNPDLYASVSH
jgi:tetratricopeptide (TPR) repeat protein